MGSEFGLCCDVHAVADCSDPIFEERLFLRPWSVRLCHGPLVSQPLHHSVQLADYVRHVSTFLWPINKVSESAVKIHCNNTVESG